MLGCDDPVLDQQVRAILHETAGFTVAESAATSGELLEAVARRDGDVVVLSETLGPLPVLDLVRQLAGAHPYAAVVLLVREDSAAVLQNAMEAGVRGLVTLPLQFEDLQLRVTNAANWSANVRRHLTGELSVGMLSGGGSMIALSGAKGGVGTTTLALHLAIEAAGHGRRVCLVDLDLQAGDIPNLLDLTHRRDISDLAEIASELGGRALDDVLFVHRSGLRILLAPQEGERAEDINGRVARAILGAIKSRFDVVVVDCGSVVTEAAAVAVEMADRCVVVVTPDVLAMRAARRLIRLWTRLQVRKEEDVLLLLNRTSRASEVQPELARKIVRVPIADVHVPASFRSFEPAVNTGAPDRLTDPTIRRAITQLAVSVGAAAPTGAPTPGRRRRSRREPPDAGQVAVEFVGMFVVLLAVLIVLAQLALVGSSYVLAGHAANEAARRAAIASSSVQDVRDAGLTALPGAWRSGSTFGFDPSSASNPHARVTVDVVTPRLVPWLAPFHVSTSAAMEAEPS